MTAKTKKRRIMHSLTMKEISGVDVPAQEGARFLLAKRHSPEDVEKFDLGMQNPRATSPVDGHQHLLDDNGQSGTTTWETSEGEDQSHSHSWIRNSDGQINVLLSEGHDHQLLAKRSDASTTSATGGGHDNPDKESTMKADTSKAAGENAVTQEQLDAEKSRADRAEKMAELTDAQKEHFQGLPKSDQESFLSLDKDGRQNEVRKAQADDPVVYKSPKTGREYRKSGDPELLEAVKSADEAWELATSERDLRKSSELSKRAGELKFVKGTDEVKVALLKAIDGIEDEDLRKGCLEIVESANSGLEQSFTKRGTAFGDGPETDAEAQYEKLSQEYAKANDCTIEKARAEVIVAPENAELAIELTQRQPVID